MSPNTSAFLLFAVLAGAALMLGYPADALANTVIAGGNPIDSNFTCIAGTPVGSLLQISACPDGPQDGQVFSYFICTFEELLSETLSLAYCAVLFDTTPAVMAALTLLVALSGVAFLMGLLPFTAKELMVLAAKFSLVLTFATQAEYMIGIGYNLFVNMAKEGIVIVLDYLFVHASAEGLGQDLGIPQFNTVSDVYLLFDRALENILSLAAEGEKSSNQCQDAMFTMLIAIAIVIPPLAFIAIYFIAKLLWMMLRAVFGYCQGLLGLTFLVVLSPIYISFALFKPTRTLFDKWVQYLISFSFQMVIVFAFLGMVFYILSQLADDTQSYADLVKPYKQDSSTAPSVFNFADTCGICELAEVGPKEKPKCSDSGKVLPLTEMSKNEEFMRFMTVKVMAMLILFYVLDIMLGFVPEMARHLSGPKYSGQLGGGAGGNMAVPGEQAVGNMLGHAGKEFMQSGNSATGAVNAVRGAVAQGLVGNRGLIDTMIRTPFNPQEPFRLDDPSEERDSSSASNLYGAAVGLTGAAAAFGAISGGAAAAAGGGTGAPDTKPAGDEPLSTESGEDTVEGSAAEDKLTESMIHDRDARMEAEATGYNPGLAQNIRQAMRDLGENPSRQEIEMAFASATGGHTNAQIKGAIRSLDLSELHSDVGDYLRNA